MPYGAVVHGSNATLSAFVVAEHGLVFLIGRIACTECKDAA